MYVSNCSKYSLSTTISHYNDACAIDVVIYANNLAGKVRHREQRRLTDELLISETGQPVLTKTRTVKPGKIALVAIGFVILIMLANYLMQHH